MISSEHMNCVTMTKDKHMEVQVEALLATTNEETFDNF
jgi:hypothetical protein